MKSWKIAEHLLAQAKLYQQIASECWDEELAATLERSAQECVEDAYALEEHPVPMV